jgi:hypothetical protein
MAQPFNYFNYRYDISGTELKDDCYAILEVDNGFVLAGSSLVISGNIYWWEKKVTKLDEYGIVQNIQAFGEDSIDYFFTNTGCIIKDSNNFYAVGKRRTPTQNWVHDEGTLMYLDENLDTLWMKKYGEEVEPYDTAYLFTCLQKVNQNELIIAGSWMPYESATHAYLVLMDSIGQIIWDKSYSYSSEYIDAYSIAQTTDAGYILGCYKQIPGYQYTVDPVLIKTDSLGNKQWTKNLGGPFKDSSPMVSIASDGNIIVGTSYADTMATPTAAISRINLIKLSNEGEIIWNKKYGPSQRSNYLQNIRVLNDGSFIAVGSVRKYNPEPDRVSWTLKTSSEGDSLWYREYEYLHGEVSRNYLYDIIETSDSGFISCGYMTPYPPDTGSTDTWVIKLDSIGCDTAGCDPTVSVIEQEKMRGREKEISIELWPNPARDLISVSLNRNLVGQLDSWQLDKFTIEIFDIFGRQAPIPNLRQLADKLSPTRGKGVWTVDVAALPSGLYLLVVKDGLTMKASAKFVVAR